MSQPYWQIGNGSLNFPIGAKNDTSPHTILLDQSVVDATILHTQTSRNPS